VPLTFEDFDWGLAREKYLTGKLAMLSNYNALPIPIAYFMEALDRLRTRYMNKPLDTVLHPMSAKAEQAADEQKQKADSQPIVSEATLSAEEWFDKGYQSTDFVEKVRLYSEAIRLKPDYTDAYNNRASAKRNLGDNTGAITDYNEAIRLKPDYAVAYNNRGNVKYGLGDYTGAIADYNEAIRLKPDFADAYNNRASAKRNLSDIQGTITDYNEAIRLKPDYAIAYNNRGLAKYNISDYRGAITDYNEAIRLKPDYALAFSNRGETHFALGQYDHAQKDFQHAMQLNTSLNYAIGGLAVTLHKLGNTQQAINLWKMLTGLDAQYRDADWAAKKLYWSESMREEAKKLVAKL
jgi:tetratricopeptide (TPR) repeat protein